MFDVREIHFDITNACNAACPQCVRTDPLTGKAHSFISRTELTIDQFKQLVPEWLILPLEFVYFCGNYGDPLAARDLIPILEYIWSIKPKLSVKVHSNCSLRSRDWWQKLSEVTRNRKFVLVASVDGATQEVQELYRVNTNFDTILTNLKTFIQGGGKVEWRYIVFKHNEHQVELAQQISKEIGCVGFKSYSSNRDFGLTQQLEYVSKGVTRFLEPSSMTTASKFSDRKLIKFRDLNKVENVDISCISTNTRSIFIDFMGNVLPCCHYGIRLYTNLMGVRDVNNDLFVQQLITKFGNHKFNGLTLGTEQALNNCGSFLKMLEEHWVNGGPFVCKMICGKIKSNSSY